MRKRMILAMCMAAFLTACADQAAEDPAVQPIGVELETNAGLREYDALFPIYMDGHEEYIDRYGNLVTNYEFDRADYFYDGMAVVEKDGRMGAIDLTGTIVIPMQYPKIRHFSCGIAAVENEDGLLGYIDNSGEMITDFEYEAAGDFSENIAVVREYPYYYFLDTKGNKVGEIDIKGSYISDLHNGLVVMQNAYYNIHGECVIENNINASYAEGFFPSDFSEELVLYIY